MWINYVFMGSRCILSKSQNCGELSYVFSMHVTYCHILCICIIRMKINIIFLKQKRETDIVRIFDQPFTFRYFLWQLTAEKLQLYNFRTNLRKNAVCVSRWALIAHNLAFASLLRASRLTSATSSASMNAEALCFTYVHAYTLRLARVKQKSNTR